jgi:hypothetical protein
MATYIDYVSPTLANLTQTAEDLAKLRIADQQRQKELAQYLNFINKNKEAEQVLYDMNAGALTKFVDWLKGKQIGDRKFESAFSTEAAEAPKWNIDIEQGKILSQLAQENPDAYKALINQQGNYIPVAQGAGVDSSGLQSLTSLVKNKKTPIVKTQKVSESSKPTFLIDPLEAQKRKELFERQMAESQAYENNMKNPAIKIKKQLDGDLNKIIADETENFYNALQQASTTEDKLRLYNKYVNSLTNLNQSFQHDYKPLPPEYFGIFQTSGKGSGGNKLESYYLQIQREDGTLQNVYFEAPKGMFDSGATKSNILKYLQSKKNVDKDLINTIQKLSPSVVTVKIAGREGTNDLDSKENIARFAESKKRALEAIEDSWFTRQSTIDEKVKAYNADPTESFVIVKDNEGKYTLRPKLIDNNVTNVTKNEEKPKEPKMLKKFMEQ